MTFTPNLNILPAPQRAQALDDPAPGIFDRSSWIKWNERHSHHTSPAAPAAKGYWCRSDDRPRFLSREILETDARDLGTAHKLIDEATIEQRINGFRFR